MTYQETVQYLFEATPLFQHIGGKAYKPGLQTSLCLDEHFGHPHKSYPIVHVAGTNGKGSCSHTIAAILQLAGLRVGLFTSPHLLDFRERIRINGKMIPKDMVVQFVESEKGFFEPLHPSFFELTTALAFKYFEDEHVDVAVVEVGLGGRLDCTNIVTPKLSVITNISLDHTQFLGSTLSEIAYEKAGIIKPGVPVVVGEDLPETRQVFLDKAKENNSQIIFAEDKPEVVNSTMTENYTRLYETVGYGTFEGQLAGECQIKNTNTILHVVPLLLKQGLLPQSYNDKNESRRWFARLFRGEFIDRADGALAICWSSSGHCARYGTQHGRMGIPREGASKRKLPSGACHFRHYGRQGRRRRTLILATKIALLLHKGFCGKGLAARSAT